MKILSDFNDIVGKRFDNLIIEKYIGKEERISRTGSKYYVHTYLAKCDCGKTITVDRNNVIKGHTTSCGCTYKIGRSRIDPQDVVGKKFHFLTIIKYLGEKRSENNIGSQPLSHLYLAKCDCGKELIIKRNQIGRTKSCGCIVTKYANINIPKPKLEDIKAKNSVSVKNKNTIDLTDIIGLRVGKLTVIKYDHYDKEKHQHMYFVQCDCGNTKILNRGTLLSKTTISCGCSAFDRVDKNDIVGKRFTRWVVLEYDHAETRYDINGRKIINHYYKVQCDCGEISVVSRNSLLSGHSKSCGCYKLEKAKLQNLKHGMTKTRFYNIYRHMKTRCCDPKSDCYQDYGGRGIKVCDRWLGEDGFIHFKEDMYDKYLEKAEELGGEIYVSIDRIDVNGNYEPGNCRWSDNLEQQNNKRNTPKIEYHGKTMSLKDCVSLYADSRISYELVYHRLLEGWDIGRALTEIPKYHNGKPVIQPIIFRKPEDQNG